MLAGVLCSVGGLRNGVTRLSESLHQSGGLSQELDCYYALSHAAP